MSTSMRVCCSLHVANANANANARRQATAPTLTTTTNSPLGVGLGLTRRNALFLSIISFSSPASPSPSFAFSIGIPGPKEWLKDQKRKSSNFLLLPIYASRETLNTAFSLLTAMDSDSTDTYNLEQLQTMLKSAARDCIPSQRNPFVAFQAQTGVEVCTFRLIVKNASSLLTNRDPVKLEAEAVLDDLIRSFTFLEDVVNNSNLQLASDRLKLEDGLKDTMTSIDKFEKVIKDCLDV